VLVATHELDLAAEHFEKVLLLNRRLIGFGTPEDVFTEPNLMSAYGGRVRFLESQSGSLAISDAGCDHDHPHRR
jgi:ABC-type Mn2+/Zn2+ transport system ATPase subunit